MFFMMTQRAEKLNMHESEYATSLRIGLGVDFLRELQTEPLLISLILVTHFHPSQRSFVH